MTYRVFNYDVTLMTPKDMDGSSLYSFYEDNGLLESHQIVSAIEADVTLCFHEYKIGKGNTDAFSHVSGSSGIMIVLIPALYPEVRNFYLGLNEVVDHAFPRMILFPEVNDRLGLIEKCQQELKPSPMTCSGYEDKKRFGVCMRTFASSVVSYNNM